jgi:DNA-binding SARP family transcriptional activator
MKTAAPGSRIKSAGNAAADLAQQTATPELRVYLLGSPAVEWAGQSLDIPRRQARLLLYCLATHLQAIARDQLSFLFWSDTPDSAAHRRLTHLLTHLRRALPEPDLLLITGNHVCLEPQRVWSDAAAFTCLCAEANIGDPGDALKQAVELYRGPFLGGLFLSSDHAELEAWAMLQRCAFERLYLQALVRLIEMRTSQGKFGAAIAYARRYLETDELAEEVHRQLIILYALSGERRAALQQFEDCTAVLERELGVSPLPETEAIYQAVLKGRALCRPHPVTAAQWATLPSLDVPLIGRGRATGELASFYQRACLGHGAMLLISGEAGVGKSRLVQDFALQAQNQTRLLVGTGRPETKSSPYHPAVQALRSALGVQTAFLNVPPYWLAEAARLLPELRDLYPELQPLMGGEPAEARARLLEALCQLVLGLAAGSQPVLLCLEDLHWADSATLDWLVDLGRRLGGQRLLVLGTYRSEEGAALSELRRSLTRLAVLSELKLEGLDEAAVLELVRHVAGHLAGDELLAVRLHRVSGGNPFFIVETLRTLIESGTLRGDVSHLHDLPLPDTVREAVAARVQRLDPKARQVIEAGAILGLTFDFESVRLTAGRREMEAIDGLDELVARQLLSELPAGYCFQHEITQRAVALGLSPTRRRLLHRRAGQALEQLEPDSAARLATHFDAGGEVEKALHYHGLAARQAEALAAWREAEAHQSRILEILDQVDPRHAWADYRAHRGQALALRADLRYHQGQMAERDTDLAALSALAQASGDAGLRLLDVVHHADSLVYSGHYIEAIATAEAGLLLAAQLNNEVARCHLLAHVGLAHYSLGQPRLALAALDTALAISNPQTAPETWAHISQILGYVHFHLGHFAPALACHQEACECNRRIGAHRATAWNLIDVGLLLLKLGRWAESRQHLHDSLALAREIGLSPAEAYALTVLAQWNLYRGDYCLAVEHLHQALPMHEAARAQHSVLSTQEMTGMAYYHLGQLGRARRWLQRAVATARRIGHRRLLVGALVDLGLVEIADGRFAAAHSCLTEGLQGARDSESRENVAKGLAALARTERLAGDATSAWCHAGEALRVAQENSLVACEAWAEMEAGLALLAQGDAVSALEHTGSAAALLPHSHEGWIGSEEIHRAHERALRVSGRVEAADEQARLAGDVVQGKAERIPDADLRQRFLATATRYL